MEFRIADTFTDSLVRLTRDAQKLVKTTAFDLQLNPAHPSHSFHRLERSRDRNFWSVRVGADIRLIVHRMQEVPAVGEAPTATHATKSPQLRPAATRVARPAPSRPLLPFDIETLLSYGVPAEWADALRAATEDDLLTLADHLPAEAAEAVLELATGGTPVRPASSAPGTSPFQHPDAQRRFRVVANVEALEQAFAFPWDKWTVFLHPDQRTLVERQFAGAARVSGSAGTGKTIVALHRAVHLARTDADARVLLTTFSAPLANALTTKLRRLVSTEPRLAERIDVTALDAVGDRLYARSGSGAALADDAYVRQLLARTAAARTAVGGVRCCSQPD